PFARDDLKTVLRAFQRPHHDRLDHAVLLDRRGEFAELGIGECAPRIARIGLQEFDRHLALIARTFDMLGLAADIADQARKPPAQTRPRFVSHRRLLRTQSDALLYLLLSRLPWTTSAAAKLISVSRRSR